jgi:transaldolase
MKLFLDTGEFSESKQGAEWGVVDGMTTDPTLIARADHQTRAYLAESETKRWRRGQPSG